MSEMRWEAGGLYLELAVMGSPYWALAERDDWRVEVEYGLLSPRQELGGDKDKKIFLWHKLYLLS